MLRIILRGHIETFDSPWVRAYFRTSFSSSLVHTVLATLHYGGSLRLGSLLRICAPVECKQVPLYLYHTQNLGTYPIRLAYLNRYGQVFVLTQEFRFLFQDGESVILYPDCTVQGLDFLISSNTSLSFFSSRSCSFFDFGHYRRRRRRHQYPGTKCCRMW